MLSFEEALAFRIQRSQRGANFIRPGKPPLQAPANDPGPIWQQQPQTEMPAGAFPWVKTTTSKTLLPAIGAAATVVSYTIPAGYNAFITAIANQFVGAGFNDGSGDLVWQLQIDGVPVRGFEAFLTSLGTCAAPGDFSANRIWVSEGQTISLVLNNVAVLVAGQVLIGELKGYCYPVGASLGSEWM